jgi:AcrR family transcriptional regulator
VARPVSIKDETIIEAARAVFLEHGFRATTADVARRAGVSEGSIFKRYRSKYDLFRAAMEDHLAEPEWVRTLPGRVGKGEMKQGLLELAGEMIGFFRELMPLIMMSWSNPGPDGLPPMLAVPNPPPLRALKQLTGYFEAEMRAGRLRRVDPEIAARSFLGGVFHFVFTEVLHRASDELPLAQETYVRGLVNLLWAGLEPRPQGT